MHRTLSTCQSDSDICKYYCFHAYKGDFLKVLSVLSKIFGTRVCYLNSCTLLHRRRQLLRSNFSNTRCWFGWFFFNFFSSQVVTTGTNSNITRKTRVSAYKSDTADDISKPSIFLCRHRTISTSESRLTTYYSSHILSMHLRVVYAVTKSIYTLIFISLRLRSARTETRSTI